VELRRPGGITRHLEQLRLALWDWLTYEYPTAKGEQDDDLLALSLDGADGEPPLQPEALRMVRESKRFGAACFPGSLMEWPFIARQELNLALDVEQEFHAMNEANLRLKAERLIRDRSKPKPKSQLAG